MEDHRISHSHYSSSSSCCWWRGGGGDRFIPLRSAMDMDRARSLLLAPPSSPSPTKLNRRTSTSEKRRKPSPSAYQRLLSDRLLGPRGSRILAFKASSLNSIDDSAAPLQPRRRQKRCVPDKPFRVLDAPDLAKDERLNLLDWGAANVLAVALWDTLHLWDHSTGSNSELVRAPYSHDVFTSVAWAPSGHQLALAYSTIQIWDAKSGRPLRTVPNHSFPDPVSALSWYDHNVLSSGSFGGKILNYDIRIPNPIFGSYVGHKADISKLQWSCSGRQLASRGLDGFTRIWDLSTSSSYPSPSIHNFETPGSLPTGLAWCPFQKDLLACGGGEHGHSIEFYNTQTGTRLNSVETGSDTCCLLWSEHNHELLCSQGFPDYQLTLWKHPSMVKIKDLNAHRYAALDMTLSPDGCMVASAAADPDETLCFWNIFEAPKMAAKKASFERSSSHTFIRWVFLELANIYYLGLAFLAAYWNLGVLQDFKRIMHLEMGLIRSSFTFLMGTGCGIYIAQNYNVPNVKKLVNTWFFVAKHLEETYRKPKKDE